MTEEVKAEAESKAVEAELESSAAAETEAAEDSVETAGEGSEAADSADATSAEEEPSRVEAKRQSLVSRSGSCDMRVGQDLNDLLGTYLKQVAGKPRRTLLVRGATTSPELVELCRRSLVDQDYDVRQYEAPAGRDARGYAFVTQLTETLAKESITSEDPIVVVGDGDLISGVLFAASTWLGGCVLAAVPTTLDAMVEVLPTPRSVDTPSMPNALFAKGNVRLALCDIDNLPADSADGTPNPEKLMGYATMVASAMAAGKNTFSDLALAADDILAGDLGALTSQILDVSKARARVAGSTALAMRQGVLYGISFAEALAKCLKTQEVDAGRYLVDQDPCEGRLLAEGMRIAARLSAARSPEKPELVDLVFTQDGLLDKLGLTEVACVVDPVQLKEALRAGEFARKNRFMLAIPMDYGRVRLSNIEDELLEQNLAAWCKSRRKLARRRAKEAAGE